MAKHEPVDEPESRFIEHEKDLMALKRNAQPPVLPAVPANSLDLRQKKLLLLAALFVPPIAISLVSGILAKLVIMAILAFTGFVILESQPTSPTLASSGINEREENINANTRKQETNREQCKTSPPDPSRTIDLTPFPALTHSRPKHHHEHM